jgi:hypothetical protein
MVEYADRLEGNTQPSDPSVVLVVRPASPVIVAQSVWFFQNPGVQPSVFPTTSRLPNRRAGQGRRSPG